MTDLAIESDTGSELRDAAAAQSLRNRIGRGLSLHRRLALVTAAIAFIILIAFALSLKPRFEAKSLIYVQPILGNSLADPTSGYYDSSRYDSFVQQQLETIVRPDVLQEAVKELPKGIWQHPGESDQSAVSRLQASLKVARVESSYEISISLKGDNPAAVAQIVNAVAAAYLSKDRIDELTPSSRELQLLAEEQRRIESDLTADRTEQAALSSTMGVADTALPTNDPYDDQLEELRKAVGSARAAHDVALAQLASVTGDGNQHSDALDAAADDLVANDPGLASLKRVTTERRGLLISQMAGLTHTNPLYQQDSQELAQLDRSVSELSLRLRAKAAQQTQAKLKLEVARTGDIQSRLENQLAHQTAIATAATPLLQKAADLSADITRLEARLTVTNNAVHNLELQQQWPGSAHLSMAATRPQSANSTLKLLVLVMALPLALASGTAAAVVADRLDGRVYIANDVKRVLHFQPIAVLPSQDEVSPAAADEFLLRLSAGLDAAHRRGGTNIYAFTGASRSIGVSELVSSLAAKMNEIGYRVAVIHSSALLRQLRAAERLDRQANVSLIGSFIVSSESGFAKTENRKSAADILLGRIRQSADLVFITTSPLLTSAEAEFVVRLADITVIVAESAHTEGSELAETFALVQRLKTSGVAAVLTDVRLRYADSSLLQAVRAAETRAGAPETANHVIEEASLAQ